MTSPSPPRSRLQASTLILAAAAAIALISAAVAISRTAGGRGGGGGDAPAAADWRMVGWAYLENGKAAESAAAYRRAAALEPGNAENWSSLGEALQVASRTVVPEAEAAFERALKLDPSDPRARYFRAVQKDLRGDHKGAVDDWLALLRDTEPGRPWEADLRRNIEQTAAKHRIDLAGKMPAPGAGSAATSAIPGPTPEQLAAAASIPPAEQDQMVQGMVERLAGRLRQNPRDSDGWIRLMRSRMVLGEADAAGEALRAALAAFADEPATQGRLRSAAAELGVPGAG
jgi:cytochrome c-type biogenesis protein CcmH